MTDKKLTYKEIVKAWECCKSDTALCNECPYDKIGECIEKMCADSIDLINRLQAKAIKEQNKNSKLRNERNRLQAQNKDLAETVHNLTIEKDALFDKAEELKAEIERLKTNLNIELENFATEYDNKIKAEAYKEFVEKVKIFVIPQKADGYVREIILKSDIDNILKELVGDDNA